MIKLLLIKTKGKLMKEVTALLNGPNNKLEEHDHTWLSLLIFCATIVWEKYINTVA